MILYSSSVIDFRSTVENNRIVDNIEDSFIKSFGKHTSPGEKRAWNNSMQFMERIVRNANVADDCGVLIKYNIPCSSKRIDFIIASKDDKEDEYFVIIELKKWDNAEATEKEDNVRAFVGGMTSDLFPEN